MTYSKTIWPKSNNKTRVVHIDDDDDFLFLFSSIFSKWFEITSFQDGRKFLQQDGKCRFDAAVIDYEMPGINGIEILEKIREEDADLPVIMLTGQGNEKISREAFLAGASDYFTKDFGIIAAKEKLKNSIMNAVEKRKAERNLLESEKKYRLLAENISDIIWTIDPDDLNFNYISPSVKHVLGYEPDEILGKSFSKLLPEDELKGAVEILNRARNNAATGPVTIETVMKNKQGKPVWTESRLSNFHDREDDHLSILGITRDISRRKEVQTALEKSEHKYRTIIENTNDIIFSYNPDGVITYITPQVEKYGMKPDEIISKSIFEFIIPEDRERVYEDFIRTLETGEEFATEARVMDNDGNVHCFEDVAKIQVDENGEVTRIIGVLRDITERKNFEEKLCRSEANYQEIFNAVNEAIFVHEADTGRIIDVNKKARDYYGYNRDEFLKLTVGDISSGKAPYTHDQALKKIKKAETEGPQVFEWRARKKSGELFWVEVNLKYAKIGWTPRILAIVRDISNKKKAQAALEKSEDKFRRIVKCANEGIAALKLRDRSVVIANRAFLNFIGYESEEVMGRPVYDFYPEEKHEYLDTVFSGFASQDFQSTSSIPFYRKDGTVVYADVSGFTMEIDGEPCCIGFFRDVSDHKKMMDALKESEQRYRVTIDALDDYLHVVDKNLNCLMLNKKMKVFLEDRGITEPVGKNLEELFPELYDHFAPEYDKVFETEKPLVTRETVVLNDRRIHCETKKIPLSGDNGKSETVLTIVRDVTDEVNAFESLRKAGQSYRATVDAVDDYMHLVDRDLNCVLLNEKMRLYIKEKGIDDAVGMNLEEICPLIDSCIIEEYRKAFETGKPVVTRESSKVDGEEILTESKKIPVVGKDGRVTNVLTVIRELQSE